MPVKSLCHSNFNFTPFQLSITLRSFQPTAATRLLQEGIRTLIPHRATPRALESLSVHELCHAFSMFITELNQEQRDIILRYGRFI